MSTARNHMDIKQNWTPGQQQFWVAAVAQLDRVNMTHLGEPGAEPVDAGAQQVHIYGIDAGTGWINVSRMDAEAFKSLASDMRARHNFMSSGVALDAASAAIGHLSMEKASRTEQALRELGVVTAAALTGTMTYEITSRKFGLDGHWLLLNYQCKDGSFVARPVVMVGNKAQSKTAEQVANDVRLIVATDMGGAQTNVHKQLAKGGGILIAPEFAPPTP